MCVCVCVHVDVSAHMGVLVFVLCTIWQVYSKHKHLWNKILVPL